MPRNARGDLVSISVMSSPLRAFCLGMIHPWWASPLPGAIPRQSCAVTTHLCSPHGCLAGLCPFGVQLGCARPDSYIKPGILRQ